MGEKMIKIINFFFKYGKKKRPRYVLNKVKEVKYKEMGIV